MKKIIIIVFVFLTTFSNAQNINEELKAINDVFPEILKRAWPGNPVYEEMNYPFGDLKRELEVTDSLKKYVHRLYICDTLKSLSKILKDNNEIIKNERFSLIYLKLIKENNIKSLVDYKFDRNRINNMWIYTQIDSLPQNLKEGYLYIKFSRVCFNKKKDLGLFYISVLEHGLTGFSTLVLIEKYIKQDKWMFVNATYFK